MSTEAASPLHWRMIEDMVIRQFGEHTKRDHIRQVREFTARLGRSLDRAEPEDLRRYHTDLSGPMTKVDIVALLKASIRSGRAPTHAAVMMGRPTGGRPSTVTSSP